MSVETSVVSVICADVGEPNEFREAMRSLRAQTAVAWELLVVGEPDLDLVDASDDRIRVVSNTASNAAERRNIGLDEARGDIVTFQEAGDVLGIAALERRVAMLHASKADAVYCAAEYTDVDLHALGFARSGRSALTFADAHAEPPLLSSVLGRRETMRKARFDGERGAAADWAYLAELLRTGVRIVRADDCEILHRLVPDRMKPLDIVEAERQRLAVLELVYGADDRCRDAAAEWRNGIAEPDLASVRTRRLARLLVRQLLAGDRDGLVQAVELAIDVGTRPDTDLRTDVVTTAAKALACPLAAARLRLSERANGLSALAEGIDLFDRLPNLTLDLARAGLPVASNRPLIVIGSDDGTSSLPAPGKDILGPFARGEARIAEHELVHELLTRTDHRPGRMVDVGAHVGGTLRPFCNDGWTVRAFEPDPANRAKLVARAQPHWNLEIDARAVSDRSGDTVEFFSTPESSGASSMTAFTGRHTATATVQTVALRDALVGDSRVGHIHFLKTDVEGHDLPALEGFPWDRHRPDVVLCEFEDNKTKHVGYTTDDLAGFLVDRGYEVFVSEWHPIVRYGIVHDFKRFYRFRPGAVPDTAWGNLIAVASVSGARHLVEIVQTGVGLDRSPVEPKPPVPQIAGAAERPAHPAQSTGHRDWNDVGRAIKTIVRWYASPSGMLLAVSVVLLVLAFLGMGPWRLYGVLGVAALALFLPWKLAALHRRASARLSALSQQLTQLRRSTAPPRSSGSASVPSKEMKTVRAELRALRVTAAASIAHGTSSPRDADSTEDRE